MKFGHKDLDLWPKPMASLVSIDPGPGTVKLRKGSLTALIVRQHTTGGWWVLGRRGTWARHHGANLIYWIMVEKGVILCSKQWSNKPSLV